MPPNIGGESVPADPADPGADHLDADHQRVGEQDCPEHVEAELRTGLRVGRNPARIVIGRARDESRAELFQP